METLSRSTVGTQTPPHNVYPFLGELVRVVNLPPGVKAPHRCKPIADSAIGCPDKGGHITKIAYQMVLSSVSREFTTYSRTCGERNPEALEQCCVGNKIVGCLRCEEGRRPINFSRSNTFGHRWRLIRTLDTLCLQPPTKYGKSHMKSCGAAIVAWRESFC